MMQPPGVPTLGRHIALPVLARLTGTSKMLHFSIHLPAVWMRLAYVRRPLKAKKEDKGLSRLAPRERSA